MSDSTDKFIHGCKTNDVAILEECYNLNNHQILEYYEKGLQWACVKGNLEVVKFLNSIGVDINNELGAPIRIAAQEGHLEIIKYLVESGANDLDWALIIASSNNRFEIVKYLIDKGAMASFENSLSIREAELKDHKDIAEYLWDHYK